MNRAEHKAKAKAVMLEYLTRLGYPKMSDDEIFMHLPGLWETLRAHQLIPRGYTWQNFQDAAIFGHMKADFFP